MGARRARRRPGRPPGPSARASGGIRRDHRRGARRLDDHGRVARAARPRVRDRVRHRLDDRRGPPVRPAHRRGAGVRRRDEPADPLRRGPHEPRVLRHAQPRVGEGADEGHSWLSREAHGRARDRGRDRAHGHPRGDARREPDHASPPARDRSDSTRRRTLRADDRRGRTPARSGPGTPGTPGRSCLRAALHRGARRRRLGRRHPLRGPAPRERGEPHRGRRDQRGDRSRQPRPAARRLEPDRAGIRGRTDLVRPARRSGCDRARPHRSRDARAARPRDRVRRVVGRARVCGHAGHGRLWLGDHRGDRGAPSRRRAHDRRHDRRRAREPLAAHRPRRAHLFLCSLGGRAGAGHHARTTCGRSSWPRRRSTRAAPC